MNYKYCKYPLLAMIALATWTLTGCEDELKEEFEMEEAQMNVLDNGSLTAVHLGYVSGFDQYGMLVPSFSVADMKRCGFDYADLINVQIGDDVFLKDVPFVTGFNEVGVMDVCLCDYNAKGTTFGFGQLHGNFQKFIGGKVGDPIVISMSKKGGYGDLYKIMHSVYDTDRAKYGTDEQFANFREVRTTGMAEGVLYRSSNPLNLKDNPVRYACVDQLAKRVGIQTEIDLADTDAKVGDYMKYDGFAATYCPGLFEAGSTVCLGLDASVFTETFKKKLGEGLLFMVDHPAPYLVHCNEGKDRCGFVSLLLEALAGASYREVADDYMVTITNFYLVQKGSVEYDVRQKMSVDRLAWLLAHYNMIQDYNTIDWENIDPTSVDLQKAAHDYVIDCGLTESQCEQLIGKLQNR